MPPSPDQKLPASAQWPCMNRMQIALSVVVEADKQEQLHWMVEHQAVAVCTQDILSEVDILQEGDILRMGLVVCRQMKPDTGVAVVDNRIAVNHIVETQAEVRTLDIHQTGVGNQIEADMLHSHRAVVGGNTQAVLVDTRHLEIQGLHIGAVVQLQLDNLMDTC